MNEVNQGLSQPLKDIFAENEAYHLQRRKDRRFRAVFWMIVIAVTVTLYSWVLSYFFGGAS